MPNRKEKLFRAANRLSRYFGLNTTQDIAAVVAAQGSSRQQNLLDPNTQSETENLLRSTNDFPDENTNKNTPEAKLINLLINNTTGAPTTKTILNKIHNEILNGADIDGRSAEEIRAELGSLIQIHYATVSTGIAGAPNNFVVTANEGNETKNGHILDSYKSITVLDMLNKKGHYKINKTPDNPTITNPGLSVILSNSTRISPTVRFVNPVTVFLNGIPSVELSRAVPFINMEFFVQRPPISTEGNKITSLSLPKFLLGAVGVNSNSTLRGMLEANQRSQTLRVALGGNNNGEEEQSIFTVGGMELLTAPQTMIMADQQYDSSIRANKVLDKFRPLLSLRDVNIAVVGSTGIMSFKTATVQLTLHDRSRLHEVAEFIRPDFYSRNEITLEYGWNHPDGESEVGDNVYGDLINGMRVKEKYMIRNSSFSFDDAGQVNINLDLAMRGASEFDTQLISSNESNLGNEIAKLRELEETIGELRRRIFPEGLGAEQREIRGIQVLNAASDARNHLTFNRDFRIQLRQLRAALSKEGGVPSAEVTKLKKSIEDIYGTSIKLRNKKASPGDRSIAAEIRNSIADEIRQRVKDLNNSHEKDPFRVPVLNDNRGSETAAQFTTQKRVIKNARDREQIKTRRAFEREQFGVDVQASNPVSLGKLLLSFIGEPLAMTGRYDDIQMIFYPFNIKAGAANRLNVANFLVDLEYFADEYARYRLNHIGRDGTLTLSQFMKFIQETLIDDHAAPSYGIGNLFESVITSDGNTGTRPRSETAHFMQALNQQLSDITPGGEFVMPVVDFYVETLSEDLTERDSEANSESDSGKRILRIHIFDRAASSYDSLGSLLQSSRSNQITSFGKEISTITDVPTNNGVEINHRNQWNAIIAAAEERNLISKTKREDGTEKDTNVRFIGRGEESLKNFLMATMPYIIFGAGGSTIITANLASMQDQQLSTVNMLRSFRRRGEVLPNGEQPGGLPMQVIPTQLSVEMLGCPLIQFAQQFFIDFQTGTTADNIYGVVSLEHKLSPGEFKTSARFVACDAFGRYNSLIGRIQSVKDQLKEAEEEDSENSNI